jgi:hypothetical protein
LVEHALGKGEVASSNLVLGSRSKIGLFQSTHTSTSSSHG